MIPCQARDFYSISKVLSGPSFILIIVAVLIILVALLSQEKETFASNTMVGPMLGTDAFDYISAMASIVFAYQGQSIFIELMT